MQKKPSLHRFIVASSGYRAGPRRPALPGAAASFSLLLFFTFVLATPGWAAGQDAQPPAQLTVEQAVRRALSLSAYAHLDEGQTAIAQSEEVREGLWDNPQISYNREETLGALGGVQDVLMLSQSFDVSGRRSLRRAAAKHRTRAASHRQDADRMRITAEARLLFHELLVAQLRLVAVGSWVGRIEGALDVVTRREAAGDASAYDRRRLQRELANARARLAIHQAEPSLLWARLASLMGEDGPSAGNPPTLSGTLLPVLPQAVGPLLSRSEARPDILAFDATLEAARVDGQAASRWWVPQFGLGIGWTGMGLAGDGRAHGYVAMATVSVPIFDRKQDEVLRASGEALQARGRRELALRQAHGEIRGRVAELGQLIEAAQQFRREAVGGTDALMRTVEAGYAGGELGILELLDASRGASDDEMTALDLEFAARRAHIKLNLLTGDGAQ